MILDAENLFSEAQTVTTGTDTGLISTNTIDLGVAGRDIGAGENLFVVSIVKTTLTMDASQALDIDLVTDQYAAINSATAIQRIGSFAANSAAKTTVIARIQPSASFERYIGLRYTVSTGNALSAGAVTSFITSDVDVIRAYDNGFDIATS